jgi:hypothetical protein
MENPTVLQQPSYDDERKRMLLAFAILNQGDYRMLEQMLKAGNLKRHIIRRKRKPPQGSPALAPPHNLSRGHAYEQPVDAPVIGELRMECRPNTGWPL